MRFNGLKRRVERLENSASPKRNLFAICDGDGLYHVGGEARSEEAFREWAEALPKNTRLVIIRFDVEFQDPRGSEYFPELSSMVECV